MAQPDLEVGIYSKLAADSSLVAAVGLHETKLKAFASQAPQGVTLPYILFAAAGGGEENVTPRRSLEEPWMIYAVAETRAQAAAIDALIDGALTNQALTLTGWHTWKLNRETRFAPPVENISGKQVWRRGAYYRIAATADTV